MTAIFVAMTSAIPPGYTVSVSGEIVSAFSFQSLATAGVYWYNDGSGTGREGEVWRNQNNSYSQIDSTTDWIIPNDAATTSFRIKRDTGTGDTPTATITTSYSAINNVKYMYVTDNTPASSNSSYTTTVYIDDGTTQLDSGSYTITANREDF